MSTAQDADRPCRSAEALVAKCWRHDPPVADDVAPAEPAAIVARLRAALAAVSADATWAADAGPPADRVSARLLAEVATVMYDVLGRSLSTAWDRPSRTSAMLPDRATKWKDRLRLARMERWLAARAEVDPAATPAADLCLWVIEHLEMASPMPRHEPPP